MQWAVEKSCSFRTTHTMPLLKTQLALIQRHCELHLWNDSTTDSMTVITGATSDRDWTLKSSLSGLLVARTSPCLLASQYLPCCRNSTEVTRDFCCRCAISDLTREENTPSHIDIFKQFRFCTKTLSSSDYDGERLVTISFFFNLSLRGSTPGLLLSLVSHEKSEYRTFFYWDLLTVSRVQWHGRI